MRVETGQGSRDAARNQKRDYALRREEWGTDVPGTHDRRVWQATWGTTLEDRLSRAEVAWLRQWGEGREAA